ncbi:hypothetical protein [Spartinivicinus ruber]|uniref:hypothetical protein n=1 Tax=Spartinivicinus ruber TaxID=2683272 RepID=UPI001CA44880|nr:hypothetical protein [Spartinivicinus ruber]
MVAAAIISVATAVAHLSCIFIGPSCYRTQMVLPEIVQSTVDGTLVAPVSTIVVSLLFIACGFFALSGAGIIRKLPFLHLGLMCISALCVLRGVSTIPLSFLFTEMVSTFSLSAGVIWLLTGMLFMYGYFCVRCVDS